MRLDHIGFDANEEPFSFFFPSESLSVHAAELGYLPPAAGPAAGGGSLLAVEPVVAVAGGLAAAAGHPATEAAARHPAGPDEDAVTDFGAFFIFNAILCRG